MTGITCHPCSIIPKSLYCGLGLIPILSKGILGWWSRNGMWYLISKLSKSFYNESELIFLVHHWGRLTSNLRGVMYPFEFKLSLPHRKQKITNAQVSGGGQRLVLDLRLDELIHRDSLPTDGYRMAPLSWTTSGTRLEVTFIFPSFLSSRPAQFLGGFSRQTPSLSLTQNVTLYQFLGPYNIILPRHESFQIGQFILTLALTRCASTLSCRGKTIT